MLSSNIEEERCWPSSQMNSTQCWEEILKKWGSSMNLKSWCGSEKEEKEFELFLTSKVSQVEEAIETFCEENLRKLRFALDSPLSLDKVSEQFEGYLEQIRELRSLLLLPCDLEEKKTFMAADPGHVDECLGFEDKKLRFKSSSLAECLEKLNTIYTLLFKHAMIVEQQPPKIIKAGSKFNVSVRFLAIPHTAIYESSYDMSETKFIDTKGTSNGSILKFPTLKMEIITRNQMRTFYSENFESTTNKSKDDPISFDWTREELEENVGKINDDHPMIVEFSENSIQKLIQNHQNGQKKETSIIGPYFLKVSYHPKINGEWPKISCFTKPLIYYTNSDQLAEAKGTLFWDTWFKNSDTPFDKILDRVPMSQFKTALSAYFQQEIGSKVTRPLSHLQLTQLTKIFAQKSIANELIDHREDAELIVERGEIFQKKMSDHRGNHFSIWDWFQGTVKLVQKFSEIWDSGFIMGFLDRGQVEEILVARQKQPPGTFLLRFSESMTEHIVISFVATGNDDHHNTWHVPLSLSDLEVISLGDRIRNESRLTKLCGLGQSAARDNEDFVIFDKFDVFPSRQPKKDYFNGTELSKRRSYASANLVQILQFPSQ